MRFFSLPVHVYFKQSDNDIQIWMAENDNIIEKVLFSYVSTFVRCYLEKKLECGDQRSLPFTEKS